MNTEQERSLKLDGLGNARFRMFPFYCDLAYHSVVYEQVKTRLSESQKKVEE